MKSFAVKRVSGRDAYRSLLPPLSLLGIVTLATQWQVLCGRQTYFFRDLGTTHIPAFALHAALGNASISPYSSFGQAYFGNPSLLAQYPFPKSALLIGWFVLLHLILALAGTYRLVRGFSVSREGALLAGIGFSMSGYVLSSASSINALCTIGWMPWVLACLHRFGTTDRAWRWALPVVGVLTAILLSGEPVLAAATLILGFLLMFGTGSTTRRVLAAVSLLVFSLGITLPQQCATLATAMISSRVIHGYGSRQAIGVSFYPSRLLEIPFPFLFGRPDRINEGSFWGYAVTGGTTPYVYSTSISRLIVLFAILGLFTVRTRLARFWGFVALFGLLASSVGAFPFSYRVYDEISFLHAFRFPIRLFVFVSLALAVLAAFGLDSARGIDRSTAIHRRFVWSLILTGVLCWVAFVLAVSRPVAVIHLLVASFWSSSWKSDPVFMLAPIVSGIALSSLLGSLILCSVGAASRRGWKGVPTLAICLCILEGAMLAGPLLPKISQTDYDQSYPLVAKALAHGGRLYERAPKDLDTVRVGQRGTYPGNDVTWLGITAQRQAWALRGAPAGLRYAFDHAPDGSHTWRDELVEHHLEGLHWDGLLKWLRADGVRQVIASGPLPPGAAYPLGDDSELGIPVALFDVSSTLPEQRRVDHAVRVRSAEDAVRVFDAANFNEKEWIVIEAPDPEPRLLRAADAMAAGVRHSGRQTILTFGSAPAWVFLAQSYRPDTAVTVNGLAVRAQPANVNLVGIPVPAGACTITITG